MPKIFFLTTFMAKKCHFMPDNLHMARRGQNYVTRNSNAIQMRHKSLKTCWCYQVPQSIGQISYSNAILRPKMPFLGWKSQYGLNWPKHLHQDLKWAIIWIQTYQIFKWDQVRQLEYHFFFSLLYHCQKIPFSARTPTLGKNWTKNMPLDLW